MYVCTQTHKHINTHVSLSSYYLCSTPYHRRPWFYLVLQQPLPSFSPSDIPPTHPGHIPLPPWSVHLHVENKTKIDPLVHQKHVLRPIFWRVKREKCRIWTLSESRKSGQQRAFSYDVVIEIGEKMELAMFYKARC